MEREQLHIYWSKTDFKYSNIAQLYKCYHEESQNGKEMNKNSWNSLQKLLWYLCIHYIRWSVCIANGNSVSSILFNKDWFPVKYRWQHMRGIYKSEKVMWRMRNSCISGEQMLLKSILIEEQTNQYLLWWYIARQIMIEVIMLEDKSSATWYKSHNPYLKVKRTIYRDNRKIIKRAYLMQKAKLPNVSVFKFS